MMNVVLTDKQKSELDNLSQEQLDELSTLAVSSPECITEGEVDDFLIHRDDDELIMEDPDITNTGSYKLMVTDNSRCNYMCGSKGLVEDMKQQTAGVDYVRTNDPSIDYNIVEQELVDKEELDIEDKRNSLSFMNVKNVDEGVEWYRQHFPKVPEDLYPIMARWNWGDLSVLTKKDVKNDKKRVKKGKKPKNCGLEVKKGSFLVEF